MIPWLIDTGPIVAYLDSSDPAHTQVARCMDRFSGRLLTTSAVITEAMYFLSAAANGPALLAAFSRDSGMQVYDFAQPMELQEAAALMERYGDTPMDYADATLVLLAEMLEVSEVLTLDRRGFSTYRTRRRRGFRMVLDSVDTPSPDRAQ